MKLKSLWESWKERDKKDSIFESSNRPYFIRMYFRIFVMLFLIFVIAYYYGGLDVCNTLEGQPYALDWYKLGCVIPESNESIFLVTNLSLNNLNLSLIK